MLLAMCDSIGIAEQWYIQIRALVAVNRYTVLCPGSTVRMAPSGASASVEVDAVLHTGVVDQRHLEDVPDPAAQHGAGGGAVERPQCPVHPGRDVAAHLPGVQGHPV